MYIAGLLDQALAIAEELGYTIRQEWLDGKEGGRCEYGGQTWLFIDLALSTEDQLNQAVEAICEDPAIHTKNLPPELQAFIQSRE